MINTVTGETIVRWKGCITEDGVGPNPQGRVNINNISTPRAKRDTGLFYFKIYKDSTFDNLIVTLAEGKLVPAKDLDTGTIKSISVVPQTIFVQEITSYTITFTTDKNLYTPGFIQIEFNSNFILPDSGQIVTVTFIGDSASLIPIPSTTGTVIVGNTSVISNIFGGGPDPREGPITFEIVIDGLQNPVSSQPAGYVEIRTYFETYQIDQGRIEDTFTPESGNIRGTEIIIVNPETSGTNS